MKKCYLPLPSAYPQIILPAVAGEYPSDRVYPPCHKKNALISCNLGNLVAKEFGYV